LKKHNGSHYDLPPGCKRLNDVIKHKGMSYARGNIFKAAYRWDEKGVSDDPLENKIYNLEKIKWFAEDLLKDIYRQQYPHKPGSQHEPYRSDEATDN
jgi:hypothetical protein